MQLVADRFASNAHGEAVDLATGTRVTLIVEPAGEVPEQLRWSERCELLHVVRHAAIPPLVDFGLLGERSRFEAWGCAPVWSGDRDEAKAVGARAARFLRATHREVVEKDDDRVGAADSGMGLWVPDASSGYPSRDASANCAFPLVEHGVAIVERTSVAALGEMFRAESGARSQVASLLGPAGSGRRTAARILARTARARGFVPVAAHLIDSPYAQLWSDRSLFLIAFDADTDAGCWSAFLTSSLRAPQPHVVLLIGSAEWRGVDGVALRSIPPDALVAAIRPSIVGTSLERSARRLAEEAGGLPGRFTRRLWRQPCVNEPRRATVFSPRSRAAERAELYGDQATAPEVPRAAVECAWPMPGELSALRRKLDTAAAWLAAGRHAPAIRELRLAVSALARRGAWTDAAEGGVRLAAALLKRGRSIDAQKAIDEAREHATRAAGAESLMIDLAALSGHAWIDRARLDEAENVAAAALAAARESGDAGRLAAAQLALSRCLFWRGRYEEAAACVDHPGHPVPPAIAVHRAIVSSRVAVGRGDFGRALADAASAAQLAAEQGIDALKAAAAHAHAFVRLNVGDLDAAERDAAEAIALAHRGHDPLRSVRARLVRAEIERRRGRTGVAGAQIERLRRAIANAPPLVRARWQLAAALSGRCDTETATIVERHASTTGLGALALYVSDHRSPAAPPVGGDAFLDHVVSILRLCQTAEDDAVVLKDVCVRLRQHLHAAAVAVVGTAGSRARVIAADGAWIDSDIAARAAAAGIAIEPHRRDDRIEAAAPVLYGGSPLAALCARWALGTTYDLSRAGAALAMTAAAAAPVAAIAVERRDKARAIGECELLGISPAMAELRRAVDAAAGAPFAVLIDGESGSGKELVARAIHRGGGRRHKPFCTLNCAALPEDLVEAELFGHARGSFTGAVADRPGVFEEAHLGTLFLDEIGELSPRAQAKVLRVVQEGELRRVGETASRKIDVRIISATNRDLRREVENGRFRLDLLYRLDVVHLTVPRLRDRPDDIPLLADHFWRDAAARLGSRATLGAATVAALARYDWPGNVRELQNVLAALAVRCPRRGVVAPSALPPAFAPQTSAIVSRLDEARRTFEERFVRAALVRTGGHRGRAAEELGITRQGLTKLMTRLGIAP
jgi:DNA-binding NtrC family response regulator/tetratricopeptide (TPR) repeat protein